jgi:hypothetical protein
MRYPPERQEHFSSFCCPPNIARTLAETNCYTYCVSDDAVWTVLYGASMWNGLLGNGTFVAIAQATDYPWSGDIRLQVYPKTPSEFTLMLRIPPWARGASVVVTTSSFNSGMEKQFEKSDLPPGEFFPLRRTWSPAGATVELKLPMRARLMEGHPLVEETRGQVAVLRGPLVYCLESPDIPADVDLADLAVPRNIDLQPVSQTIAGVQVAALEGELLKYQHRDWGNSLYREVSTAPPQRVRVRMTPYFCWDNRGMSEMSIWLPLD